ncbi:MAG: radical SAM protein [Clostridia bacterium]|nr:radical SAM protein [Clostridia bacterium]
MQKNVYMIQADYLHAGTAFLPFATGALIANATADPAIAAAYRFFPPLIFRTPPEETAAKLDAPFLVGFSNYIWNFEYNKALARAIKAAFPACITVFGGHNITPDGALLQKEPAIDVLMFGEGEEPFAALLTALDNGTELLAVPNIAYRKNGVPVCTPRTAFTRTDYPSPYLNGVFDSYFRDYPQLDFLAILETVRGCPYTCAYCDDGGECGKVRAFPEERALRELRWLSDHGISGFGVADENFGMFERDERFTDEMIRLHRAYGVLKNFQASYAKNSNERVFRITKKLNDCGMLKGATISFQSLNPETLAAIQRKNIPVETFSALMDRYNAAGIATYSELILGLPGETYESFVAGVGTLLDAGQHNAIYIHNCEWLPLSPMGRADYVKKHGIRTAKIPLNQPHRTMEAGEIPEYSHIVVRTNTMPETDWVRMNLFAAAVQTFHHEGALFFFALYLHEANGVPYADFYKSLLSFLSGRPDTLGGRIFAGLGSRFTAVTREEAGLVFEDRRFGEVGWPAEEYAFLNIAYEIDRFYSEIKPFLLSYFTDMPLFDALLDFQRRALKLPEAGVQTIETAYDFKAYFSAILCGGGAELKKTPCMYTVSDPVACRDWPSYARYVVWYGRKDRRNVYLSELQKGSGEPR